MKKITIVAGCCFAIFILAAVWLSVTGLKEHIFAADAAVVLGNEVFADGTCSPRLKARLDAAVRLFERGVCRVIIVSGGVGESGYAEAYAMRDYLVAQGVSHNVIVVDCEGVNTRATARFTACYLAEHYQEGSAIVVTQFYHVPRCVMAFREEGIKHVGKTHSTRYRAEDVLALLREIPAYVAYWLGVK